MKLPGMGNRHDHQNHANFVCYLLALVIGGGANNVFAAAGTGSDNPQDTGNPQDQVITAASNESGSSWSLGIGVAVTDPGYIGVNRQVTPLPLIWYHNGRFFAAGASVGYLLSNDKHYAISILAKPRLNRLSASESPQLVGIQRREWSIDGGGRLDLFGAWGRFSTSVFTDLLNRYKGTEADVQYSYPIHMTGWTLSPGIGIAWENSPLTDYYYGVSASEAIPSRPAYTPGRTTNPFAQLGLFVPLDWHWQFQGGLQYLHFASAIQNSPIVDRSNSLTLFLAVSYKFKSHSTTLAYKARG
ncbi:MAG: MipA/OmpV family protein [Gammaproteobacteria bacterium]